MNFFKEVQKQKYYLLAILASSLFFYTQSHGYKIGSATIGKKFPNIHESMTLLAQQCLLDSSGKPENCWHGENPLAELTVDSRRALKENEIAYASPWPDDPTRHLDRWSTNPKFGALIGTDCNAALDENSYIDIAGLLCSSHYGRLQFMHAMESSPEDDTGVTRNKILAWAKFAFGVAMDRSLRSRDYCETVKDSRYMDEAIQSAFEFSNSKFCHERPGRRFYIFPTTFEAWKISTFFSFTCSNPLNSGKCWEKSGDAADEAAREAAIGSLLHLVQDSYSQSHVARTESGTTTPANGDAFSSLVVCGRVFKFFNYASQMEINDAAHEGADMEPYLDSSCSESNDQDRNDVEQEATVDDVITASAMVLWHLKKGNKDDFMKYLEISVFPEA